MGIIQWRKIDSLTRRRGVGFGCALLVLSWSAGVRAEPSTDEIERWVPAFAIENHIVSQRAEGFLQSSQRPPDAPGSPMSGVGRLADPSMGLSFELMTPGLLNIPGRPRAFLHGGASYTFASTVPLVQEGAPGELIETPVDPEGTQSEPPATVIGQGTRTSAEIQPLAISAGAGVAFSFDIGARRVRLKPSFEYVREQIEGSGEMLNVSGTRESLDGVVQVPFDKTRLFGSRKKTLHGLGGGLEIEMDAAQAGPFDLSIFAGARVYGLLGDRSFEFASREGDNTTSWSVTADRLLYQAGVGLRFRYLPR